MYETLSETDQVNAGGDQFRPNYFIDVSEFLDQKLKVLATYKSEISDFPFPRSEVAIRALALLRGSQSGCQAAEAFKTIIQRI